MGVAGTANGQWKRLTTFHLPDIALWPQRIKMLFCVPGNDVINTSADGAKGHLSSLAPTTSGSWSPTLSDRRRWRRWPEMEGVAAVRRLLSFKFFLRSCSFLFQCFCFVFVLFSLLFSLAVYFFYFYFFFFCFCLFCCCFSFSFFRLVVYFFFSPSFVILLQSCLLFFFFTLRFVVSYYLLAVRFSRSSFLSLFVFPTSCDWTPYPQNCNALHRYCISFLFFLSFTPVENSMFIFQYGFLPQLRFRWKFAGTVGLDYVHRTPSLNNTLHTLIQQESKFVRFH